MKLSKFIERLQELANVIGGDPEVVINNNNGDSLYESAVADALYCIPFVQTDSNIKEFAEDIVGSNKTQVIEIW